ncbi:MAG TPA: hypothetical protein VI338_03610 [Nitrososphaera sp.]|nr:hypothetical protein [Nitrososphaera sp.]
MELERPRKMELLHTPKTELARMMRENAVTAEEVVFLFNSNKLSTFDIRMNSPGICDKLLNTFLKQSQPPKSEEVLAASIIA